MKKHNTKSWKEAFRLNRRGFLYIFRSHPQMILSKTLQGVWAALTPYVGIYFSARVIQELAGGRDPGQLSFWVLLTLGSAAGIALVSALLKKWKETQWAGSWFEMEYILTRKILETDYVNLDETENADLLYTIRQNKNAGGWGLYRVLEDFSEGTAALLGILGGISLTLTLFLTPVPAEAVQYAWLNSPWVVLLVVAVMLGITLIAPILANQAESYWAKNADLHRLEKICEKHNQNKEDTFHSKGIFARYARGAMGFYSAASGAVSVIFTGVAYGFVCLKAWAGAFGLGAVTQYVASITQVSEGVSKLITYLGDMRNNASFLELEFRFLDIPDRMYQGSLTVEKRRDRKYEVEFRDVSFKYPGSENYALSHVNMKFEVGKRLAVVGMNGSGKTTFIKLLCRLYDPTEGQILLNGIDIRKYNYGEYMNIFSVVFQDFQLFALPLGQNVAGQVDYDPARAEDCLQKAGFGDRLEKMPKGLETYLYKDYDKEGVDISGGEAQKIAIARALYKDAPFIILDEPTAALDPIAEAEIYEKFDEIVEDKTAIYISHRLSSCKFCDRIAVFHEGSVIQQGTHTQLLSDEAGQYYALWNAQAQYYSEEAND